ncbi:MAG: putative baseplate assembly protein [Pleurocapsa sp. MO_226.B13]|nr:putative baseplate assembly protein [Pleurocapsa sp. MO_226.B13]
MVKHAPKIDQRTAQDIAAQVQQLLEQYTGVKQNTEDREETPTPQGARVALVKIFARFAEIIIERLNQVPDKNFLAFLDLLGASPLPPQPARVPLTFFLAAGTTVDAVVPIGTQVAAPPAEGEQNPVIFETERELVVSAAQLESIFVRDPQQDLYSERSSLLTLTASEGVPAFQGNEKIAHIFYIGHDSLFSYPTLELLSLTFELEDLGLGAQQIDPRSLQWEIWDGKEGIPLPIQQDNTDSLTKNGQVNFFNLPQISPQTVNGQSNRWLRCKLLTPITPLIEQQSGMVRATQLSQVKKITLQATINLLGSLKNALTNSIPLDLEQPFLPFGEKPKFGDTFYLNLENQEFFAQDGIITLTVDIVDPAVAGTLTPDNLNLRLQWEFWHGQKWTLIGTTSTNGPLPDPETGNILNNFQDTTNAFTNYGAEQQVSFSLPQKPQATTIGGIESVWIRVQIVAGDYGKEATYEPDRDDTGEIRRNENGDIIYVFTPATFAPPVINLVTVQYNWTNQEEILPEVVVTENDFVSTSIAPSSASFWKPFSQTTDQKPTLYFGFSQQPSNRNLSLFVQVQDVVYGDSPDNPFPSSEPRLVWQYWNGQTWTKLTVRDETEALTRSGIVEFLAPPDFASRFELGKEQYWLRVKWDSGDYQFKPKLQILLLNTTMAAQMITITNEILGSSDRSEEQKFRTAKVPVLEGQKLEVREPEKPSDQELAALATEESSQINALFSEATGSSQQFWVRWHQVKDFYKSEPRDRHYILDRLTGKIIFGDGHNGLIPPRGRGNIRMTTYQTGGGKMGNKPAKSIVQLKTTVPYVDRVINYEAAAGGAEAETRDSLIERAPREIRHRNRAVTREDYEDLAKLASPEVNRAKCIPLANLQADLLVDTKVTKLPGAVSVIIVPRSREVQEVKPLPSLELIRRVQDYLEKHAEPTVNISVVGPPYVRVDITAEIALTSLEGASEVAQAVEERLEKFLHPLKGGFDKAGWDFGRQPYKSDFYRLLEGISGVDHVRSLRINDEIEEPPGAKQTDRFLVYSGNHDISLILVES